MRWILIGFVVACVAGTAAAQTPQDRHWCEMPGADDDVKIAACTALIASTTVTPAERAAAFDNRSNAERNKGLYDQAIADDDQSLVLNPNVSDAYDHRGIGFAEKGLYAAALADFNQAIVLNAGSASAYNDRAFLRHLVGEDAAALPDVERSLRLAPEDADALETRAEIRERLGQRDLAIEDYRAALRIQPGLQLAEDGLTRLGVTP
ncbi:MAG TPA: hypothetical protein VKU90_06465 [Caulobacteraceae bacterium]|nr:hypothetical protein [Caulobacteraceae bacterium]